MKVRAARFNWSAARVIMKIVALAALVGGVVLAAGCGSSGSNSSAASTSSQGSSTSTQAQGSSGKATGADIVIFSETYAGTVAGTAADAWRGAQAAAEAINKAGGVNGHDIRIVTCNNQLVLQKMIACAINAKAAGAVGTVNTTGPFMDEVIPYYERYQIPLIFPTTVSKSMAWTSPISFPIDNGSSVIDISYGPMYAMGKLGLKTTAGFANNFPQSVQSLDLVKQGAKIAGVKYSGTVTFPPTTTDFTSYALQLKQLGADGLAPVLSSAQYAGLLEAQSGISYSPKVFASIGYITPAILHTIGSSTNGLAGVGPALVDSVPGIKMWRSDLQAAGDPAADMDSTASLNSWLGVRAIADVVKTMTGPITNVTFLAALHKVQEMNLYGLVQWRPNTPGPSQWPRLGSSANTYFYTAKDGQWVQDPQVPPIDIIQWASSS
jgi:ABC-type branched-subunit amino acid transport system substrate-binding protein